MLAGYLAVQIIIGYEWFISGLVKVWRGGFPAGLAEELQTKSTGVDGWYRRFLDETAIPNAQVFGYVTMISELIAGIVLIGGAIVWFFTLGSVAWIGQGGLAGGDRAHRGWNHLLEHQSASRQCFGASLAHSGGRFR